MAAPCSASLDERFIGLKIDLKFAFSFLHLKTEIIHRFLDYFMHVQFAEGELEILFIDQRHLEHPFHLAVHAPVFLPDDIHETFDPVGVADHHWTVDAVGGQ